MSRFIYLAEAQNGLVKIGCSAVPYERLKVINLHSPIPCRLVAVWIAGDGEEAALHSRFDASRRHNEWFALDGDLARFVEGKRGLGLAGIASWDEAMRPGRERRLATKSARHSERVKALWADPAWRLNQLCQTRAGQAEARAFAGISYCHRTPEQRMEARRLGEEAKAAVLNSAEGRRLLAQISANRFRAANGDTPRTAEAV